MCYKKDLSLSGAQDLRTDIKGCILSSGCKRQTCSVLSGVWDTFEVMEELECHRAPVTH